ncbi:hypothetical protein ABZY44_34385 [Streptomyces sp. NPDC006544]|uniref:hypothetical protein n=1 Tax=Streptomyces sp. NPDC006544 TaxID=3154583 RepID=UPI0033AC30D6
MAEVEAFEPFDLREVSGADPHHGALGLPVGDLPLQQSRQVLFVGPVLITGLRGQASQQAAIVGVFSWSMAARRMI